MVLDHSQVLTFNFNHKLGYILVVVILSKMSKTKITVTMYKVMSNICSVGRID